MNKLDELTEVEIQIAALQERATLLRMEGRAESIRTIILLMARYSITSADLDLILAAPKRPPRPIKYRNDATGQTWTGQGKQPKWMIDNKEQFAVAQLVVVA